MTCDSCLIRDHPWRVVCPSDISILPVSSFRRYPVQRRRYYPLGSVRHPMTYCSGVALWPPLESCFNVPIYKLIGRSVAYYSYILLNLGKLFRRVHFIK